MTGLGTGTVHNLKREMAAQSQSRRHDASPLDPHKAAANFATPNTPASCQLQTRAVQQKAMHIGFIAVIASGARRVPGLSAADMLQLYRGKNDECPMGLASVATFPGEIPELYQDL